MRSIIKKLLKFNVLIIGLALSSQVYAQQISPIEVLSYKEFVKKHNIEGLYSQDSDKTIFCGDKETTCNRKTQICLRCSFYKSGGAISGGSKAYFEEGTCVSRIPNHPDDYDKQEIRLLADQARFCLGEINTELEKVVGKIKGFAFGNTKKQLFYEKNGFIGAKTVRLGLFINVPKNLIPVIGRPSSGMLVRLRVYRIRRDLQYLRRNSVNAENALCIQSVEVAVPNDS